MVLDLRLSPRVRWALRTYIDTPLIVVVNVGGAAAVAEAEAEASADPLAAPDDGPAVVVVGAAADVVVEPPEVLEMPDATLDDASVIKPSLDFTGEKDGASTAAFFAGSLPPNRGISSPGMFDFFFTSLVLANAAGEGLASSKSDEGGVESSAWAGER